MLHTAAVYCCILLHTTVSCCILLYTWYYCCCVLPHTAVQRVCVPFFPSFSFLRRRVCLYWSVRVSAPVSVLICLMLGCVCIDLPVLVATSVCMRVSTYEALVYLPVSVHVSLHVSLHVCLHVCLRVCRNVRMCTCTCYLAAFPDIMCVHWPGRRRTLRCRRSVP